MVIGGQTLSNLPPVGWKRFSSTPAANGLAVDFCLDPKGSTDLYLSALEYGLPAAGQKLLNARGNAASESQDGDMSYRFQHIELPVR
jgi:hypothetical protein